MTPQLAAPAPRACQIRAGLPVTLTHRLEPRRFVSAFRVMPDGPSVAAEVGQLFRTKRVSEIRQIESSVRSDAEERAGQLRSLLGTRYKDLLRAAEDVSAARHASQNAVQEALARVARDANSLRADFLTHSSTTQPRAHASPAAAAGRDAAEADLARRRETSVLGGRLLHIVDSPEVLYACLEGDRVEEATVRFAASEKAHAELDQKVARAFARNRWNRVEAFRSQIVAAALAQVETQGLGADEYAGSFIALAVLSEEPDALPRAVDAFLSARTKWLADILDGRSPKSSQLVSKQLTALALIVHDTVTCCGQLFFDEPGLVVTKLASFHSKAADEVTALRSDGTIAARINEWIAAAEDAIVKRGGAVVADAKSAADLASALDAVHLVFEESEFWESSCKGPLGIDPAAGVSMLRPIVCDRAKLIAGACVQSACETAVADIETAFSNISDRSHVGDALWSSIATHAVRWKSQEHDSSATTAHLRNDDLARQLVRTGATVEIVDKLDCKLGQALTDVDLLVQRIPEVAESLRDAVSKSLPSVALCLRDKGKDLAEEATAHRASFAASTKVAVPSPPRMSSPRGGDGTLNHSASIERALFAARTAAAISHADHVAAAFAYGNAASTSHDAIRETPELMSFYKTAHTASEKAYEAWAAVVCVQFESQLRRDLPSVFSLELRAAWDKRGKALLMSSTGNEVSPQNGIESHDNGLEERPPCPTAPSPGTLRFVLASCEAANSAGGLALPPFAVCALTGTLLASALSVFNDVLAQFAKHRESIPTHGSSGARGVSDRPENVYLQLLFDIRFLAGLLDRSDSPSAKIPAGLESVESSITSQIDPINLSSIKPAFDESVECYLARSNVLVGTLARPSGAVSGPNRRVPTFSNTFATANILAVAEPVARFAYLPAPMPSTYTARTGLTAGLGAKAAVELLQTETDLDNSRGSRDAEVTVADYASKLSENVGRFGRGFLDSFRGAG